MKDTTLHRIAAVAVADWGPAIERAAKFVAVAVAITFTAGLVTGQFVHKLNDRLAAWVAGRHQPQPVGLQKAYSLMAEQFGEPKPTVQRQAVVPHRAAIAAPRVHPAVALAASGLSQRAIAAKLGCTRYEVRKALKG
jgi:hypothetical protein